MADKKTAKTVVKKTELAITQQKIGRADRESCVDNKDCRVEGRLDLKVGWNGCVER